jgi:hypothetical protein
VVNASGEPLDATWDQVVLSDDLPSTESSPFLAVPSGRAQLELTAALGGSVRARSTLEAVADAHTSLLVTPGSRVTPLVHRFAAPGDGTIRARLVHAAESLLTATLEAHQLSLQPWTDSGPEGLELAAGQASTLWLATTGASTRFTVPALPAKSEVLLVILQGPTGLSVLGVAPSAVLGFLPRGGAP